MSLTSLGSDKCALLQYDADAAATYSLQMDPIQNYRPEPGPQGPGISVDRLGSAQGFVDLESLLRNQGTGNGSASNALCGVYADQANAFGKFTQEQQFPPIQTGLTPQVQYTGKACSSLSELSIDRFDFLPIPGMGFQCGYAQVPLDTVNAAKDSFAAQNKNF